MKSLKSVLLCAGVTAMMLSGCGTDSTQTNSSASAQTEKKTVETEQIQHEETEQEETQQEQTSETEPKEVGNVIASSVSIVEILDAMDIPMAGVPTSSYDLPESAADAVQIGNAMSPDLEVITSLEPDYIISVDSLEADLGEQFSATGAQVYFADLSSYEGLKTTIANLGDLFETQEKAQQLVAGLEEKAKAASEKMTGDNQPKVLIIFGAGSSFMAASENTYVGDLVRMAGGVNVAAEAPSGFSPIDMEYLAEQNPDYILLMAHANPEESLAALQNEFDTNEAWQNFDAVQNGNVYALDTGYFGMSANLLAGDALEKLAEMLYQEN